MQRIPVLDGQSGDLAVAGAVLLLLVLVIAIAAITIAGKPVPDLFIVIAPSLLGFIIGTRVVPSDVASQVRETTPDPTVRQPPSGTP